MNSSTVPHLVARILEETILDHPACLLDAERYALADRAVSAINELYQRVAAAPDESE